MLSCAMLLRALALFPWLLLVLVWVSMAFGNKPAAVRNPLAARLVALAILGAYVALAMIYPGVLRSPYRAFSFPLYGTGVLITFAGAAFAIWARMELGRNWSANPSVKEGHELVKTGPYRWVRHPIYTGLLAASLGTAITSRRPFEAGLLLLAIAFIALKVRIEEKLMTGQFPQEYPLYRAGTKAIIPFVL
jgi:protein-S-isoprenylcysteine O-methyltransferase Ste14